MKRRAFIQAMLGTAAIAALPALPAALPVEEYTCSCGLVVFRRQPSGHFSASHFVGARFDYRWFRYHQHLHDLARERGYSPEFFQRVGRKVCQVVETEQRAFRGLEISPPRYVAGVGWTRQVWIKLDAGVSLLQRINVVWDEPLT